MEEVPRLKYESTKTMTIIFLTYLTALLHRRVQKWRGCVLNLADTFSYKRAIKSWYIFLFNLCIYVSRYFKLFQYTTNTFYQICNNIYYQSFGFADPSGRGHKLFSPTCHHIVILLDCFSIYMINQVLFFQFLLKNYFPNWDRLSNIYVINTIH